MFVSITTATMINKPALRHLPAGWRTRDKLVKTKTNSKNGRVFDSISIPPCYSTWDFLVITGNYINSIFLILNLNLTVVQCAMHQYEKHNIKIKFYNIKIVMRFSILCKINYEHDILSFLSIIYRYSKSSDEAAQFIWGIAFSYKFLLLISWKYLFIYDTYFIEFLTCIPGE